MAPNLQRFCSLLAKAKLAGASDLEKIYRAWRTAEPEQRENLPAFVQYLVKNSAIREAQIEKLIQDQALPTEPEYDVELIRVRDPLRKLDMRDLLMLVIGIILGAIAILITPIWHAGSKASAPPDNAAPAEPVGRHS